MNYQNENIIDLEFSNMLNLAKEYFEEATDKKFEHHQCIVLKNKNGDIKSFSFASNSIKELINQSCDILHQENITAVSKIICMWEGEFIDVPAYQFLKELCDIEPTNKNAEILLKSSPNTHIYTTKKLSDLIE